MQSFFTDGDILQEESDNSKNTKQIKMVIDNDVLEQYEAYYFAIHRKASKKPIAHPYHESINTWMIMKRPMMNALKQKWKDFIVWFIRAQGYANLHIEQCEVEQTVYYPNNRRHDIDNSVPKFILDGMVESGLILVRLPNVLLLNISAQDYGLFTRALIILSRPF